MVKSVHNCNRVIPITIASPSNCYGMVGCTEIYIYKWPAARGCLLLANVKIVHLMNESHVIRTFLLKLCKVHASAFHNICASMPY